MADESKDIKKLIKLQKQRPAFSRMISWEISQAAEYQPVKKGKRKKKKTLVPGSEECVKKGDDGNASPDDIEETVDDSSEYETACEEEGEIEVRGQSVTESEDQLESIGSDILDSYLDTDCENEEDEEDELFMSCIGNDTTAVRSPGEPEHGRRRRLSKKQKRKRRDQAKVIYLDDLFNLGNLFDATDEISDVFTEVLAAGPDVEIQHRVPTLVELCLKTNRRKHRYNSEKGKKRTNTLEKEATILPYGMKKLISQWGWSQKQLENQLSFFLNKVLPLVENQMKAKAYVENSKSETDSSETPKPFFPRRSIWAVLPFAPRKSMLENGDYGSERTPSFLYTVSSSYHTDIDNFHYTYYNYYVYDNVTLNYAMWVLSTAIDLMLPSQTGSVSPTTSIIRVKRALSLRYKTLVDILFEKTLPYVMWARGKIAIATDMFRNLVENETETNTKAMYLSEIARMHAIFGDTKTAEQFYRVATETALEDYNEYRRDRCINEATEQKQVLLASIYDIGVLDEEKAVQSFHFWTGVKSIPTVRTATLIAGLDALLCYHLSHLPVTGSKLYDEAIGKLEKVTKECPYAFYYLSMLHAFHGTLDISTKLYRESRSCCSMTPGPVVLSYLGQRTRNPWQPLIDRINTQTLDVRPLSVIWRTNLQPPRITKHRPMEGQVCSEKLNLRLNDAGHVTGDMQMMMPPLRDISLDPYTGYLMMDNQPSQTGMWTSAWLNLSDYHCCDLLVPTYRLIYSGNDGTTVHMLKLCNTQTSLRNPYLNRANGPPCSFILHWTSPDGQVAKLNMHALLKNKIKEKVKMEIQARQKTYINTMGFSMPVYMKCFEFLDIAAERNITITENVISNAVWKYYDALKKAENAKRDKSGKIQMPKRSLLSYLDTPACIGYLNWELMCEPYVFGKAVLLQVKGVVDSVWFVIVNTESKTSFLDCSIKHYTSCIVMQEQVRNNYTEEEYLMVSYSGSVLVLNKTGETVVTLSYDDVATAARDGNPPVIIYPKLFGVNKERNSIWCTVIGLEGDITDIENKICWTIGSVYDELSDGSGRCPYVKQLTYIGKSINSTGKLLMANLHYGLAFINPNTLEYVPVTVKEGCGKHFEFTKDNNAMKGDFENIEILTEKAFMDDQRPVYRIVLGVQNKVFILEMTTQHEDTFRLEMIFSVDLPGLPKEACLVGKQIGMLISLTQHNDEADEYYREHVFYFDFDGLLHGVLLCLSHGPRSFFPVYLHGNTENEGEGQSQAGWHVYLRDGRDGIMCLRLH